MSKHIYIKAVENDRYKQKIYIYMHAQGKKEKEGM